jgi:phosphate transport system permease protein
MTAYMLNIATGDHEAGAFIWSTLFTVGSTLFLMTLVLNIMSHFLVRRFRERYE